MNTCDITRRKNKYKGVRQRKWGKWVSEIRVPGTKQRLWLGSYVTQEAAAVARDVAYYSLHKPSTTTNKLNFPLMNLPSSVHADMSPRSVQKAASDAGMAIDAQFITLMRDNQTSNTGEEDENFNSGSDHYLETENWVDVGVTNCWSCEQNTGLATFHGETLSISVEDYL